MRRTFQHWHVLRERLISIDPENSAKAPDSLTVAALIYVALPNFIFVGGWLRAPVAIFAVALLLFSLWQFYRRIDMQWKNTYTPSALALIITTAFSLCSLSGAGHFFYANPDWYIRDAVAADLTLSNWPPYYSMPDGFHHVLRSAIGFFLPAASIAKIAGLGTLSTSLYLWLSIGVSLFLLLLPLPKQFGPKLALALLLVIFFGGMDFLGLVLVKGDLPVFPFPLTWWVPFNFPPWAGQMFWSPNHGVPILIATALFYRHWGHQAFPSLALILLPMLLVWTPFAVPAILPFVVLALIRWKYQGGRIKDCQITVAQVITAALLSYLMLRFMTLGLATVSASSGPTVKLVSQPDRFILKYLVFILMEYLILALLMLRGLRHSYGLFGLSLCILAVIPLYQLGPSNDAMLRLSIPPMTVLMVLCLQLMQAPSWRIQRSVGYLRKGTICTILLIGSLTTGVEMWRVIAFRPRPPNYGMSLVQASGFEPPHYVARLNRYDLILLLRPPSQVPVSPDQRH